MAFAPQQRGAWIETQTANQATASQRAFAPQQRGAWIETIPISIAKPTTTAFAPQQRGAWIETTKRSIRNEPLISEDALRRALARMSQAQSQAWLVPQWLGSVQAALNPPWILTIDTPVKPLYGKQGGAQVSDDWWRVRPRPTWWDGGG